MTEQKTTDTNGIKPKFFYGYIVVIAAFCIMMAYMASRSAYGIFFDPIANEFGWNSTIMSGPSSISMIMDGILGIIMGRFADKLGPRRVLTFCGAMVGVGYILMSRVTDIWQLYLFYGVINGIGMAGTFVPTISNLSRWFISRRNTMNGIVLAGMGVGTLLVSPIAEWLISTHGWRTASVVFGLTFVLFIVVAAQFMRLSPAQVGQEPYHKIELKKRQPKIEPRSYTFGEVLGTKQLWQVWFMFFCNGFYVMSVMVHIVPNMIHLEISAATAANVLATLGALSIAGRLFFGAMGDRIGSNMAYGMGFVIIAPILFWLVFIRDTWMFYVFAAILGFAWGGMNATQTPLVAGLFGLKSHGVIFGVCGLGATVGASIGPVLTGNFFDRFGNYQIAFFVCALTCVAGIIISSFLIRNQGRG